MSTSLIFATLFSSLLGQGGDDAAATVLDNTQARAEISSTIIIEDHPFADSVAVSDALREIRAGDTGVSFSFEQVPDQPARSFVKRKSLTFGF